MKNKCGYWGGKNITILPDFDIGDPEKLIIHDFVRIGHHAFIDSKGGVEIKSGIVTGPYLMIYSENNREAECLPFSLMRWN